MSAINLELQTSAYKEVVRLAGYDVGQLAQTNVGKGDESAAGVLSDLARMAIGRCLPYATSLFPSKRIAEQAFYGKYRQFIESANSFEDINTVETVVDAHLGSSLALEIEKKGARGVRSYMRRKRMQSFIKTAAKTSPHYSKANAACNGIKVELAAS